jgi:hypothetical protein
MGQIPLMYGSVIMLPKIGKWQYKISNNMGAEPGSAAWQN